MERRSGPQLEKIIGRGEVLKPALLIFVTVAAYIPALQGGFVWDDDSYVTRNPTLGSVSGLHQIWFRPGATTQYYPLVHTTFWIEHRLWQEIPFGYHLVNALLHGLSVVLLWRILRSVALPGAWFAAALFALHPVHVESVAWITERKNVLSGFFYLAAFLTYIRFRPVGERGDPREGKLLGYLCALALFVLALLSKTVTATLPAAVLLLLWWKHGRVGWRDMALLVPFFLLGIGMGAATAWIERNYLGAQGEEWQFSFDERVLIAGRALWFYAGKLAWPHDLTFIYPRWEIDTGAWWQRLFPASALLTAGLLWTGRKKIGRGPLVAALFFAITLSPALGFIDVYPFRFSFVADHFQYLASIGLIALFAAVATRATGKLGRSPAIRLTGGGLVLILLGTITSNQGKIYRDVQTLWRDTIEKNPTCWMAYNNLGQLVAQRGEQEQAIELYEKAIAIKPGYDKAHNNLGIALASVGRVKEAIVHYRKALEIDPSNVNARNNFGLALESEGMLAEAIAQYAAALRIRPRSPELHTNLGVALSRQGKSREAIEALREAVRLKPDDAEAHFRLAVLLMRAEETEEARVEFEETVRLDPEHRGALRWLR